MIRYSLVLAVASGLLGACASAPRLALVDRPQEAAFGTLVVEGLSPGALEQLADWPAEDGRWDELIQVHTGAGPPPPEQPPIFGRATLEGEAVRYRPRFPLVAGLEHHARFEGGLVGEPVLELDFLLRRPEAIAPRVVAVDPGLDAVPANLLRVYVTFSAPMHARDVLQHVRVVDDEGKEVLEPFVELPDGLWDPERRRLTLFFDPGRIKRGVGPNVALGPPLQPGVGYRLVIAAGLEGANGAPLAEPRVWSFRTLEDDRASPDPERWRLVAPAASRGAVELVFDEPLDRALAERLIQVVDSEGARVPGTPRVTAGGRRWVFEPAAPWARGEYALVVNAALEDLAGNALGHLFEERLLPEALAVRAEPEIRVPFVVR